MGDYSKNTTVYVNPATRACRVSRAFGLREIWTVTVTLSDGSDFPAGTFLVLLLYNNRIIATAASVTLSGGSLTGSLSCNTTEALDAFSDAGNPRQLEVEFVVWQSGASATLWAFDSTPLIYAPYDGQPDPTDAKVDSATSLELETAIAVHAALTTGVHGVAASTVASVANITTHAALDTGVHGAGASTLATEADISTHAALTTGVHGAGASTLATAADITTHAALTTGVHGVGAGTVAHLAHTHAGTTEGVKLAQANTHESADTDSATSSLHHTVGTSATQAAAGNHAHAGTYEPADAALQTHITGTGSPHTAAGVGAEAAGAVSSHAGLVDGTAHSDSGVADPAVSTLTVTGGAVSVAVTTAARRFFADNAAATTLTVSAVTGLTNGGEPVTLVIKTTGSGLTVTWPGTPVVWGDAPTAAGEYCYLLWYNSSGVLNVLNPGDSN